MTTEIELKLSILPDEVPALLRWPVLVAAGEPRRQLLSSRYYDTPELDLMMRQAAFRVRHTGQSWVQTIKIGGTVVNGLHSRPEWEMAVPDDHPYPELFTAAEVRAVLNAQVVARLQPIFQTVFWRSTWLVDYGNGSIEVALDQGEVSSGGRTAPICEVEFELKSGKADAITRLADTLAQHIKLTPDSVSKAQRGYALYRAQHVAVSE
ncbi:MAG: CYTH domain-containing protein [Sulfuriferula sp.]|nr:CYTH domain-containing protein [Sulfuriferula sp.]